MFGSLVVVFPTPHEGGALMLCHSDQEWTFDSVALTRDQLTPSIAYIDFYSDIKHKVSVVESDHRVTLTYNLFSESGKETSVSPPVAPDDLLRDALSAALDGPNFLPEGGHIEFGLSFQYPISGEWTKEARKARSELGNNLKGSDAVIYRVSPQNYTTLQIDFAYNMASEEILRSLAKAVTSKPPFCTGTLPISTGESTLFYKQDSTASWLDLSQATEPQLEALSRACVPATFGRNEENVLDESYRKAGKMDFGDFSILLNVEKLGIVDRICVQLLDAADDNKTIKTELYKLNVYGKGSFFKSHKDTPRGENMFGSLVVVFPTPHQGGALVLRHSGQEWTFDSAALTREQSTPSVAYIAFYSDVDHEVTVVESGYRVTLTYNLFFEMSKLPSSVTPVAPDDQLLRDALSAALSNPSFLPEGGYLGFGLSFKYPVGTDRLADHKGRSELRKALKGSDAVIYRVCKGTSLATSLNAVYHIDDVEVLVSIANLLEEDQYDDDIIHALCHQHGGHVIHEFGQPQPVDYDVDEEDFIKLAWVTPLTRYSTFSSHYITYGNEPSSGCEYADLCIAVKVGPFSNRSTVS
ncbi:hypothetical protein C0995_016285 [Termitomyces sp. Mi166|nr:hypothetical protein C0995_016285 [Termitomyces sp. Mi166\